MLQTALQLSTPSPQQMVVALVHPWYQQISPYAQRLKEEGTVHSLSMLTYAMIEFGVIM